jgi:hypothetical protein
MNKDTNPQASGIQSLSNLWLCKDTSEAMAEPDGICDNNGEGVLHIHELLFNVFDPEGVGAYEFVVKFDHKVFDVEIKDTRVLYKDGGVITRIDGGIGCAITILTENSIRYACVSKDNPSTKPLDLGLIGEGPFVLAIINVTPEPDLKDGSVLRPAPGNALKRTIVDNNCQAADIFGDPLRDVLGSLLPGIDPGGLIADCSNATLTVRILEGDVNQDCRVDAADAQGISPYVGSVEGDGTYNRWYDLEPVPPDGDIDSNDVQVVTSRQGSTCKNPMPAQPPSGQ